MILKKFSYLLLTASLFVAAPFAQADTPDEEQVSTTDEILKRYSYEEIQGVANYLLAREEQDPMPAGKRILACDPPIAKVRQWSSGSLKALMDQKRAEEFNVYMRDPKAYSAKAKKCSERCTCNAYALLISEAEGGLAMSEAHKQFDALISKEAKKETKESTLACAKKLNWFCGSPIHQYLEN